MPTPSQPSIAMYRMLVLITATIVAGMCVVHAAQPSLAQQGVAPIPYHAADDPWLIDDDAKLFSVDEMNRFQFDLRRLQGLGESVMVYTRRSDASRRESEGYAKRVREAWGVESAPGADDGMLLLITIGRTDPSTSTFVISSGSNFFPVNQLKRSDLDRIYNEEVEPAFNEGRYDLALAYGVRRVLYAADYTPPDPAPLTGVHSFANTVSKVGGPILLQAAVLGLFVVPAFRNRRLTLHPSPGTVLMYVSLFGSGAVLLALVSVVGRSGLGITAALLVLALVLGVMAFFLRPERSSHPASRRIPVRSTQSRVNRHLFRRTHQRRDRYVPQA